MRLLSIHCVVKSVRLSKKYMHDMAAVVFELTTFSAPLPTLVHRQDEKASHDSFRVMLCKDTPLSPSISEVK